MFAILVMTLGLSGCDSSTDDESVSTVTLYTSVDAPYVEPIIQAFEADHPAITVSVVTDTEATKSVGLAERLRAEQDRPRANVWWGNEPFYTVALARDGLLAPYEPATASDVRPLFKDAENRWVGNGLRLRVIVHKPDYPADSLGDLADEGTFVGRPTAGTTGGHVAALYVALGTDAADELMRSWHAGGVQLAASNSAVVREVAAGSKAIGLTDNDDVANGISRGLHITMTVLGQREGELGTLAIPTTVALVAGSEDNAAAQQLADFLASQRVEQMLEESGFIAASVRDEATVKVLEVDYAKVAEAMPEAIRRATAILEGREP